VDIIQPDYKVIARQLIRVSARVQPGEAVTILGRADSLEFCEALELECRRVGALPLVVVGSDSALLAALSDPDVTLEQLASSSPPLLAALKASDLVITTFFERANPLAFHPPHILPERIEAQRRSEVAPSDIIFDGKRRWLGTEIPTPAQAEALGCQWETLHNNFWEAMQADYVAIGVQAEKVKARLSGAQEVRILADNGTDLTLKIGGRPLECDDGIISEQDIQAGALYLNMPSGEVCFAPPEYSAQGRAVVEAAFWQGRVVRELVLNFDTGLASAISAAEGLELFREVVGGGGKDGARLGEFGIGLNPAIERVIGFTLLDEKIYGTIHLALGENRPLGGTNNSQIHWDLVLSKVTVLVDGLPLLQDGKLLV
jgi:aminopeptidase